MEEISVNGENYVKASSLARELGYTSDYVGQLCRAKQIKATLIGRTWYVNETSLRAHKEGRYRSTAQKSRNAVKEAVSQLKSAESGPNYLKRLNLASFYETDETPLYPSLQKNAEEKIAPEIKPVRLPFVKKNQSRQVAISKTITDTPASDFSTPKSPAKAFSIISARGNQVADHSLNIQDFSHKSYKTRWISGLITSVFFIMLLSITLALLVGDEVTLVTEDGTKSYYRLNLSHIGLDTQLVLPFSIVRSP